MNEVLGRKELLDCLRGIFSKASRVVAIGASMGGFCQLVLASKLEIDCCLLFGAQTSIQDEVENRWSALTRRYRDGVHQDALAEFPHFPRIFAFSGTQAWRDIWQQRRLRGRPNVRELLVPWGQHNVALDLRNRDELGRIIQCSAESDSALDEYLDTLNYDLEAQETWVAWADGWSYLKARNYADATPAFGRATELSPSFTYGFYGLAQSKLLAGDLDGAEMAVNQGIRTNPSISSLKVLSALIHLQRARMITAGATRYAGADAAIMSAEQQLWRSIAD